MRLTGSFQTTVTHGASKAASWPVIGCSTSTGATPTCRHLPSSQVSHSPDVSVPLPPDANAWTYAANRGSGRAVVAARSWAHAVVGARGRGRTPVWAHAGVG